MAELIVALDGMSAEEALALVDRVGDACGFYKVGLELYTRGGPDVVRALGERDRRVFLDLKLYDIPNTVAGAVRSAAGLDVELLTVHVAGGPRMLEAAREAAKERVKLVAVTLLTSLGASEVEVVWGREIDSVRDEVARLAELARNAGMDGLVASALEASWLRRSVPSDLLLVTPGIRPAGADRGDQRRVATPAEAVAAGADYLVVGRPVTRAPDPRAAVLSLSEEIAAAGRP
ncbi:MAG: orotidine-5'-phosphate decarboxylase [Gemmatimonadetes bacterium]|nr:orotidine-5'-phosphate decarboxylase [Gemmatimonadota bacterium]